MFHMLTQQKIIGGAPKLQSDGSWTKPSIVVSGPHSLNDAPISGAHLAATLNVRHIADTMYVHFRDDYPYLAPKLSRKARSGTTPPRQLSRPVLQLHFLLRAGVANFEICVVALLAA